MCLLTTEYNYTEVTLCSPKDLKIQLLISCMFFSFACSLGEYFLGIFLSGKSKHEKRNFTPGSCALHCLLVFEAWWSWGCLLMLFHVRGAWTKPVCSSFSLLQTLQCHSCFRILCRTILKIWPASCMAIWIVHKYFVLEYGKPHQMWKTLFWCCESSCIDHTFLKWQEDTGVILMIIEYVYRTCKRTPKGGRGCLMSPSCLESQGFHLIPLCYLLSCSSV